MCINACDQEEQHAVRHDHYSSPRVTTVPEAALHVLPTAAFPTHHSHQNAY